MRLHADKENWLLQKVYFFKYFFLNFVVELTTSQVSSGHLWYGLWWLIFRVPPREVGSHMDEYKLQWNAIFVAWGAFSSGSLPQGAGLSCSKWPWRSVLSVGVIYHQEDNLKNLTVFKDCSIIVFYYSNRSTTQMTFVKYIDILGSTSCYYSTFTWTKIMKHATKIYHLKRLEGIDLFSNKTWEWVNTR